MADLTVTNSQPLPDSSGLSVVGSQPLPRGAVSPGTSDEDIIRGLGFDPKLIQSSPRYRADLKGGSTLSSRLTNPAEHPQLQAWRNAPVVGQVEDVGQGANDVLSGLVQLARHGAGKLGMLSDADVQYGDLIDRLHNQDYLTNVRQGNASPALRLLGNILVPVPGGVAAEGASVPARIAKAAVQGGAAAALQPVEGDPNQFWQNKGRQVATGAVVAPVVAGAADLAGKGIAKAINAGAAGGIPQEAADVLAAGQQHGVRLTYGDISRNPSVQKAEVTMESLPGVGMSGTRAAQQVEAKTAATTMAESRYQKFLDTDPGLITDIQAAAKSGDVRARNLLDQLQNAGSDPDKVLQTSIGLGDFRTRQEAEHLYDNVEDLVKRNNLPDVPLANTTAALQRALTEAQSSKLPDRQLIGILSDIKAGISPKAGSRPPNPFPPGTALAREFDAQPVTATSAGNDYAAVRQLRSDLGNKIQMYMSGENGIIGEKGVGQLQAVKNGLENDLSDFTQKSGVPEVQQAAQTADQYYKTARVPFKDQMLAAAANDKEPDQIFQRFIQAGKGDRAQRFYDALDPKGQEAVRYKILATSLDKATDETTETFSPQKYFSSINKLKDATRVFFQGADEAQVDGFANLMSHVTRAGQYAENPPNGQRMVAGLVTAGTILNPVMAARVAAVAVAAKTLFTTDAGKAFLLASSKLQPGSPQLAALTDSILGSLPAASARAATQPQQPSGPPQTIGDMMQR